MFTSHTIPEMNKSAMMPIPANRQLLTPVSEIVGVGMSVDTGIGLVGVVTGLVIGTDAGIGGIDSAIGISVGVGFDSGAVVAILHIWA